MGSLVKVIGSEEVVWIYDSNTNTITLNAQEIFNPNNGGTSITLLGEQTSSSNACIKVIYNSTDASGLGSGIYPFLQITYGNDLYIGVGAGNSIESTRIRGNVGIGYNSLYMNTTGSYNISIGYESLYNNTGGGSNIGIGTQTLYSNTEGSKNIAIGDQALFNLNITNLKSTSSNIAIGYQAGYNYTGTENDNIIIGNSINGVAGESGVIRIGTGIQLGASTQTTTTGTSAGSLISSMPFQSASYKKFIVYANGYENTTTTAQTLTYPTAFTQTPIIVANNTGMSVTASTSTLTLPTSMSAAATGWIIIEGY